jgi:hypothetical protein
VFTLDSAVLGLASSSCGCCAVRVFEQDVVLEDAIIRSHACLLEAKMRVINAIPLGSPLLLPLPS